MEDNLQWKRTSNRRQPLHKFVLVPFILGHFGASMYKVSIDNSYFLFSPLFKISKYAGPAENTLKSLTLLALVIGFASFLGF